MLECVKWDSQSLGTRIWGDIPWTLEIPFVEQIKSRDGQSTRSTQVPYCVVCTMPCSKEVDGSKRHNEGIKYEIKYLISSTFLWPACDIFSISFDLINQPWNPLHSVKSPQRCLHLIDYRPVRYSKSINQISIIFICSVVFHLIWTFKSVLNCFQSIL